MLRQKTEEEHQSEQSTWNSKVRANLVIQYVRAPLQHLISEFKLTH